MHAAVIALLVFVSEVMGIFGNMLAGATQDMPDVSGSAVVSNFTSFNLGGLDILRSFMLPLVIVFTITNALAPSIADGGSKYKFCYNFGITAIITGISLLTLPELAKILFQYVQV